MGWGVGVAVGVGMGVCVGVGCGVEVGAALHPVIRTAAAAASRIHCAGGRSIRLRLVMGIPPIRCAGADLLASTGLGASIQHYPGKVNDASGVYAELAQQAAKGKRQDTKRLRTYPRNRSVGPCARFLHNQRQIARLLL